MTDRVAAAKSALLNLLHDQGPSFPKEVVEALGAKGYSKSEIYSALQTALGQNEVELDEQLRLADVRKLEAAA